MISYIREKVIQGKSYLLTMFFVFLSGMFAGKILINWDYQRTNTILFDNRRQTGDGNLDITKSKLRVLV